MQRRSTTTTAIATGVLLLASTVACTSDDAIITSDDRTAPNGATTGAGETEELDGDVFTPGDETSEGSVDPATPDESTADEPPADEPRTDDAEASVGSAVSSVVESLPPVPETGVPGIESDDAFCRAWSTYAGSVQALSLAWASMSPAEAASLEVAATDAVSEAVAGMAENLPSEIESNRRALTVDVPGPFLRRAERARTALVDAGASDGEIDALGATWVAAITDQGIENESLALGADPDIAATLDEAAAAFAADVPSLVEDPTLDTTEFDISPSLSYIADTCPDQATLAGNDVVESGGS